MKALKLLLKTILCLFALVGVLTVALILYAKSGYLDINIEETTLGRLDERVELLRTAGTYAADSVEFNMQSIADSAKAAEIRAYFQLDTLYSAETTTWEKTLAIAKFVSDNIPHANQKAQPTRRDAITLWEYTKTTEPAFNCRLHSILLYELLSSVGITASYITCMPKIEESDCHVVNQVWLPELLKWAMIDSDQANYATDEAGTPLSLSEIRERYISGEDIWYHPHYGKATKKKTWYYAYMAKNLYWFSCWETLHFGQECLDENQETGRYVNLVPSGYQPYGIEVSEDGTAIVTSDARQFWAAPQ